MSEAHVLALMKMSEILICLYVTVAIYSFPTYNVEDGIFKIYKNYKLWKQTDCKLRCSKLTYQFSFIYHVLNLSSIFNC